jgi:16S rRNA (uracil1498-N3)-methyltransferase
LKEAAEQSRRGLIPVLNAPLQIQEAFYDASPIRLIAWEKEQNRRLNDIFNNQNATEISLLIGPEGGFSEHEVQSAISLGWIPFSLGKRILRMETAAIVACALILHQMGEI